LNFLLLSLGMQSWLLWSKMKSQVARHESRNWAMN